MRSHFFIDYYFVSSDIDIQKCRLAMFLAFMEFKACLKQYAHSMPFSSFFSESVYSFATGMS